MLQRYLDQLGGFFDRLSSDKIPFCYVILTFFAAAVLRTFAEHVFLASVPPVFWGEDLAHYTLSYVALALTLILFLHAVAGDPIMRAARIVLPGFILLNTVPLIDRLLGVQDVHHIAYFLSDSSADLLVSFLTFFGPLQAWGVTPGMRVEIAVVMCVIGLYIFHRTRLIQRAVTGAFLFYVLIFSYVATPFWIKGVMGFCSFSKELDSWLLVHWYVVLVTILSTIVLYLLRRDVFKAIVEDMRVSRLVHYLLFILLGFLFYRRAGIFPVSMDREFFFRAFFLIMGVSAAWLFSVITNNEADRDIDRISNPDRPSVSGAVSAELYRRIGWGSFCCAGFFAFMAGIKEFEIVLVFMATYFLYSMPPLRLKRVPVLSKFVIGINSLLMFMLGYGFVVNRITVSPGIVVFFLIFLAAAANFIDLKDHDGDAKAGIRTLSGLIGLSMARKIVGGIFILTYLAAWVVFDLAGCFWVCLSAGVLQYILINRGQYDERPVFVVHLLSLVFILSYVMMAPR
jgi:4-hydroxybenzoate polyprenyltransferase